MVPAIVPELIGPLRVATALSFTLVVAAEFMGAQARIGYRILVTPSSVVTVGDVGDEVFVYIHQHVRDDAHLLYGFAARDERVCFEALIGALFLDGGMDLAKAFILKLWEPDLSNQRRAPQHPKSALQELAAAKGVRSPVYEVVSRTGAHHAPRFTVRVSVPTLGDAIAEGTSKQEAETAAATELLSRLK